MLKVVYVLTSDITDFYYEQLYISVLSLRLYNTAVEICLLMDDLTEKTMKGFRAAVLTHIDKKVCVSFQDKIGKKERSRILKTSMRRYIEGDFLFIDCDTVVTDSLQEIETVKDDIAMVLDKHVSASEDHMDIYKNAYKNAGKMNYSVGYDNKHFNSGVIWIRDTKNAHDFFDLWSRLYLETLQKGLDIDQVSLNETNDRMHGIIAELSGIWNVQINCGLKYLTGGKIIHYLGYQPANKQSKYFTSLPFQLADERVLKNFRRQGYVTGEINNIIHNPKEAFKTVIIIPEDCIAYPLLFSNHMRVLKFTYVKLRRIYMLLEKLYGMLFRLVFNRS